MLWYCAAALLFLTLAGARLCYRMAFSVPKQPEADLFFLPDTAQYAPFREVSAQMIRAALAIPYEDVWITSRDGLRLHGKLYPGTPGAPVQLLFHGYRSAAERDFCGGLQEARKGGCSVLLVDQRAHGKSQGRCLSFGILERYDCLCWVQYAIGRFGPDCRILLYGMSMGAATVLMAAGLALPENVAGIVADCGYTSPAAILQRELRQRGYPFFPTYALVRLGGRLFGGFDLEQASAAEAMERCRIPVLLIHGGDDRFVPCAMSRENYDRCASPDKRLLIVPGAGHGLSYLVDRQAYLAALTAFQQTVLTKRSIVS